MIAFSKYYNLSTEDVEYIEATDGGNTEHLFRLTVHLKSGRSISVNYTDSKARDSARAEMVRQVEYQKRQESEKVLSLLYTVKYAVERI